jgi:pilus assembly protein Flp/PilA
VLERIRMPLLESFEFAALVHTTQKRIWRCCTPRPPSGTFDPVRWQEASRTVWARSKTMKRVRLAVGATGLAFLVSLALVPLSSLSVNADANPDNPGHHYGWYKHHPSPPPPPPSPRAVPPPTAPPVTPPPVTQVQPRTQGGGGAGGAEQNAAAQSTVLVHVPTGALIATQQLPDPDEDWWLVLALALVLAVFWLYVFVLLLRTLVKTQRRRAAGAQGGQGMVEYALILVLVSIVVIVVLLTMGNQIANVFSNIVAALG